MVNGVWGEGRSELVITPRPLAQESKDELAISGNGKIRAEQEETERWRIALSPLRASSIEMLLVIQEEMLRSQCAYASDAEVLLWDEEQEAFIFQLRSSMGSAQKEDQ